MTYISYDPKRDVLYLALDHPEPCTTIDTGTGLILRTSIATKLPSAVTILDFKYHAAFGLKELSEKVSEFLNHEIDLKKLVKGVVL